MDNKDKIFDMRTKRLSFVCVVLGAMIVVLCAGISALNKNNTDFIIMWNSVSFTTSFYIIKYIIEEARCLRIDTEQKQPSFPDQVFDEISFSFKISLTISFLMSIIHHFFGYFQDIFYMIPAATITTINIFISFARERTKPSKWKTCINCIAIHLFVCYAMLYATNVSSNIRNCNHILLNISYTIDINTIINIIIGALIPIIIFIIEYKNNQKIKQLNEQYRQQKITDDANRFVIANIDEIQWLPLCPIACMNNKYYNYHRKIYKLFNAQPDEVKLEILKIREIDFPINFTDNLQDVCIDAFNAYNKTIIKNDIFAKNNKKHFERCMQNGFKTLHRMDIDKKIKQKTKDLFEKVDLKTNNKVFEEIKEKIDYNTYRIYEKAYIETEIMRLLLEKWNKENDINISLPEPNTLEDLCLVVMAEIYIGQLQKYSLEQNK